MTDMDPFARRQIETLRARIADLEARVAALDGRESSVQAPQADPRIVDALNRGRMIEAIKLYRETTGADLATAKLEVERLAGSL